MVQLLLIVVFVVVLAHDGLGQAPRGWVDSVGPWGVVAAVVGAMLAIWLSTQVVVSWCAYRLDRDGRLRVAWTAERAVGASRLLATLVHAVGVYWLGWLVAVREIVGDLVLVDEVVAVLPPILVFVGGWASLYPIDRRMREALIIRALDEGQPIEAYVSFGAHVMSFVRHQVALIAVPVLLIMGWSELVHVVGPRVWVIDVPTFAMPDVAERIRAELDRRALAMAGVQVAGALVVFATAPLLMRYVWRTRRLEDGELRRDLLELCAAHRVRVRELLVWDTHGVLVNGAVMGVAGAMRFVLLSDGLLGGLTRDEVEAVAAHEVGHVRRRHIPWLAGAVVSSLVLAGAGADRVALLVTGHRIEQGPWLLAIGAAMLVAGGLVFGWVSRRFEWQADAFAAQHLSGARPGDGDVEVTPAAAGAMEGALAAVARLNHIPAEAPSFRHGSIASRRRRLRALVGRRADRLPIDRTAARIKAAIALGVVATVVLVALDLGG